MITETIGGDLLKLALEGEFDVIVHGANCFNTMNAGIAAKIKKVFPEAYFADSATKKGDINKLGTISVADVRLLNKTIQVVNAYTQYDYRRKPGKVNLDYDALRSCFVEINLRFRGKKIGIPKIGAGLAGGNWEVISEIINEVTPDVDITLVTY